MTYVIKVGVVLAYIGCIVAANWAVANHPEGTVVWPYPFAPDGIHAPAGVWAAGFCFTFRNLVQQTLGRWAGFLAIGVGALLSATVFQSNVMLGGVTPLPVASGITFALSEGLDATVWTYLREHRGWWTRAMLAGDVAGQVLDSLVFLLLAFGSLDLLLGQIIGKWWTLSVAVLLMEGIKRGWLVDAGQRLCRSSVIQRMQNS